MVRDGAGAADGAVLFVQGGAQLVVGALLPVGVARRTGRGAIGPRGRQQVVELAEFVVERFAGKGGNRKEKDGEAGQEGVKVHGLGMLLRQK